MEEVWKFIEEYPNIEISNLGNIKKYDKHGELMHLTLIQTGKPRYLTFNVYKNSILTKLYLHRQVMKLHGPEQPEGMTHVCFLDKNTHNCNVNNLYWSTQVQRMHRRKAENGYDLGEDHFAAILNNEDVEILKKLYATGEYTQVALAKMFDAHYSTVANILAGRQWKHIKI